jgi:RNA polymerase sigma-70 factor (ECF subfamily)
MNCRIVVSSQLIELSCTLRKRWAAANPDRIFRNNLFLRGAADILATPPSTARYARLHSKANQRMRLMDPASLHTAQLHGWLDRLQAGDLAAREELLRSVGDRLERLARKMLGRFPSVRQWAETCDVQQNAVLRLLRALHEIRPPSVRDFFGLAAEQMRRELLDLARQASRARRAGMTPLAAADDSAMPDAPAATEDVDNLELWQRFHEIVQDLPVEEREVVSLVYYHGWSQPQVAELFGVTERTVRRRWRTACVRMQERLQGRFPGAANLH